MDIGSYGALVMSECMTTPGSYTCICAEGHTWDGVCTVMPAVEICFCSHLRVLSLMLFFYTWPQ